MNVSTRKQPVPNMRLRQERERRGWTHRMVADKINLPDSHTVSRWERGMSFPSPFYRQELCRIFEKSLEELDLLRLSQDASSQVEETEALEDESSLSAPSTIPAFFTLFIGREQEIVAVCDLLKLPSVRLLTLLGTGGIGKTRLGTQVAMQMRDHFADGVCFISLLALKDPALVVPAIAEALGIQGRATLSIADQVKAVLREKHLLLLLDNFEHVIEAAPFLEDVLGYCLNVKMLVTSREALHLSAEHEYALTPLSVPDLQQLPAPAELLRYAAVALFVQRVQLQQPTFQVTQQNMEAIAQLCVHLNGLPLALELAASRMKLLSPHALLDRISQVLHFLKSDLRTTPERHRTLSQTITWSYDLLTPQEQWFFRQLSVFIGGATLETIETFFAAQERWTADTVEHASSLLNKSLLQRIEREDEESRFIMLEIIRLYGVERLRDAHELEESKKAHAVYFLAEVERAAPHLKGPQLSMWLRSLEREADNLRAALGWLIESRETELALRFCEAFGKFCGLRGYWSEEQHWLKAALALPQTPEIQGVRAKVLRRAGHLAYRLRNLTESRALYEESIGHLREIGDKQTLAGALSGLGRVLYRQNEIVAASTLLQESVEAARQSGDLWVLANALESRGKFLFDHGEISVARSLLEESIVLARTVDKESLARILTTLVMLEVADGNMRQAEGLAQESFDIAQQLGTRPLIALALDCLADIAFFEGNLEQARQWYIQRVAMAHELGDTQTIASKQLKIADIVLAMGDSEQATRIVEENLKLLRVQGDVPNVVTALSLLGDAKRTEKDPVQAAAIYREALMQHKEAGDRRSIERCLIGLLQIMLDQEQTEQAICLFGFTESWLKSPASLYPAPRAAYEDASKRVQSLLGEEKYAQARYKGHALSLDQVIAFLL